MARAAAAHPELHQDLSAWFAQSPEQRREDLKFAKSEPDLATLNNIFAGGKLIAELASPPKYEERYPGSIDDLPTLAHWLWRRSRSLSIDELVQKQHAMGGTVTTEEALTALRNAGWCEDPAEPRRCCRRTNTTRAVCGPNTTERERGRGRRCGGRDPGEPASRHHQARDVRRINVEPRLDGCRRTSSKRGSTMSPVRGELCARTGGRVSDAGGVKYLDLVNQSDAIRLVLGYLNHDMAYFKPSVSRDENIEESGRPTRRSSKNTSSTGSKSTRSTKAAVAETHNRIFRGWVTPEYSPDPVIIARWNPEYPLWPYQNAAVRRMVENRGGGCFLMSAWARRARC